MKFYGISDRGKVRKDNQDAFLITDGGYKFNGIVVCDGMGGTNAGNVASKLAADVFFSHLNKEYDDSVSVDKAAQLIYSAIVAANTAVYEKSSTSPEFSGMGTTLVGAVVIGSKILIVNVGDSRAYFITSSGIVRITKDHSVVEEMVTRGDITREEARHHPQKNLITRAIGTCPNVNCDIFEIDFQPGGSLLLCTDGLSNMITDDELFHLTASDSSPEEICRALVELSLLRGAPDNVTAVLLKC